jgi:very-short-patch-repair endonuclease
MSNPLLGYWYRLTRDITPQELELEYAVAQLGIRYRPQHLLISHRIILDIALPDYMVALEVDDKMHNTPKGIRRDTERTAALVSAGWAVARVTNAAVDFSGGAACLAYMLEQLDKERDGTMDLLDRARRILDAGG